MDARLTAEASTPCNWPWRLSSTCRVASENTQRSGRGGSSAARGCPDRPADGTPAAAGLLLATWTVAFLEAHRSFRQALDAEAAKAVFLAIVDRATMGLKAALAGTPYA